MAISLSPEGKLGLSLTTGVLVYGIFQMSLPTTTDVRTVEAGNSDVQGAERAASWTAAAAVAGISLISRSPEVFVIGGLITTALAWTYRHADQVNPITQKATGLLTNTQIGSRQAKEDVDDSQNTSMSTMPAKSYDPVF